MSRYILNPDIALRSWRLVPYAYYRKGVRYAKGLKKEEFEFLLKCDGKTELEGELPLAEKFLDMGFIAPARMRVTCLNGKNTSTVTTAIFLQSAG